MDRALPKAGREVLGNNPVECESRSTRGAIDRGAAGTETRKVLEGLLPAWRRSFPEDRFLLSSRRARSFFRRRSPESPGFDVKVGPGLPGTLWLQTLAAGIARRAGAELFLGTLSIVPTLSTLPCVALIHDLTPLLFPVWHSRRNRPRLVPFIAGTVRRAKRIATVSDATSRSPPCLSRGRREDGRRPERAPPAACGPGWAAAERRPPTRPFSRHARASENVLRLVEALESIWDRRPGFPDLVLAGGEGWGLPGLPARLAASRHAERSRPIGWVDDVLAAQLLRHARLLAYPSLYEGFGFPPLEAMALGTPVVGSSASSFPEVIGDAGLLPDPESVPEIAAAVERTNDDKAWRAEARARGFGRAGLYRWEASAAKMRALCQEALA